MPLSVETPPAILVKLDYWRLPVNPIYPDKGILACQEYFLQITTTYYELWYIFELQRAASIPSSDFAVKQGEFDG